MSMILQIHEIQTTKQDGPVAASLQRFLSPCAHPVPASAPGRLYKRLRGSAWRRRQPPEQLARKSQFTCRQRGISDQDNKVIMTPIFLTTHAKWPTLSFMGLCPAFGDLPGGSPDSGSNFPSRWPYGKTAVDAGLPTSSGQPVAVEGQMLKVAMRASRSMAISTQSPSSKGFTYAEALMMSAKTRMQIRPLWLTKIETILWMFLAQGSFGEKTKPTPSALLSSPEVNCTRYLCMPSECTSFSVTTESRPS
mmetsp:Transcript_53214/g.152499  ORF Transcript_53214/g.152499 Transcript_53214/m.152499 type:complete len:250 (+) Transcript_53214:199-948(+)